MNDVIIAPELVLEHPQADPREAAVRVSGGRIAAVASLSALRADTPQSEVKRLPYTMLLKVEFGKHYSNIATSRHG